MDFVSVTTDDSALLRYAELMKTCFPKSRKFDLGYLRWLYRDNPDGAAVGFDAMEEGRLVAHYACVPAMAALEGVPAKVLLSLNTATHPAFQGRGLFTRLAERTYEAGNALGAAAVYGVANANSTPGFVRKLGFQLVAPLEARVGVGPLLRSKKASEGNCSFERIRSDAGMRWRCNSPHNPIAVRSSGNVVQCFSRVYGSVVAAYCELNLPEYEPVSGVQGRPSMLRLFLGLVPAPRRIANTYVSIPASLRPSPLNMIYRSLSGRTPEIDKNRVSFSFMDFDAY